MTTDPIRWVCGICLRVIRDPLTVITTQHPGWRNMSAVIFVSLPQCCGRDMLIAGDVDADALHDCPPLPRSYRSVAGEAHIVLERCQELAPPE